MTLMFSVLFFLCGEGVRVRFKGCEGDSSDDNDADKSQHGCHVVIIDGCSDPESSHHRNDDGEGESDDVGEVE